MVRTRPAEIGGVAGAVAFLICYLAGVHDAGVLASLGVVLGFVPAAITWLVVTFRGTASAGSGSAGK